MKKALFLLCAMGTISNCAGNTFSVENQPNNQNQQQIVRLQPERPAQRRVRPQRNAVVHRPGQCCQSQER